jgi:crotonobetainyl-CoA:carnitine CoA-transferase CaiB-like acyl-CoA transferase
LAAGVPAAPALRPEELFDQPWLLAARHLWEFEHPQFGHMAAVRAFAEYSRTPAGWPRRAPLLGEHTREVLVEWGLDPERVEALIAAGAAAAGQANRP